MRNYFWLKELQKMGSLLQSQAQTQQSEEQPCQPFPWEETQTRHLQFSQTRKAQETRCLLSMLRPAPVEGQEIMMTKTNKNSRRG